MEQLYQKYGWLRQDSGGVEGLKACTCAWETTIFPNILQKIGIFQFLEKFGYISGICFSNFSNFGIGKTYYYNANIKSILFQHVSNFSDSSW